MYREYLNAGQTVFDLSLKKPHPQLPGWYPSVTFKCSVLKKISTNNKSYCKKHLSTWSAFKGKEKHLWKRKVITTFAESKGLFV